MSGIVGVVPIHRIGVVGAARAAARRTRHLLSSSIARVLAEGGLPLGLALPAAITITAVVSSVVVIVASAARPL